MYDSQALSPIQDQRQSDQDSCMYIWTSERMMTLSSTHRGLYDRQSSFEIVSILEEKQLVRE